MRIRFSIPILFLAATVVFASGAREDESFSYQGISRVEINAEFLSAEVRGGNGESVSMRSDLPEDSIFDPRDFTLKHEVTGDSLRVWIEKKGDIFGRQRGTLFFVVPAGTLVTAETASGSLRIEGLIAEEVKANTVSGSVLLNDIDGHLMASSVSGSLEARRIHGVENLSTTSGTIEMSDLEGQVSAVSVSGSIEGDRILLTRDSLFKTVSGSIRIDLRNALDEMRYELSTVSGGLTVGSVRAARGLQMGNGNLTLRGETISGSQTYR